MSEGTTPPARPRAWACCPLCSLRYAGAIVDTCPACHGLGALALGPAADEYGPWETARALAMMLGGRWSLPADPARDRPADAAYRREVTARRSEAIARGLLLDLRAEGSAWGREPGSEAERSVIGRRAGVISRNGQPTTRQAHPSRRAAPQLPPAVPRSVKLPAGVVDLASRRRARG